MLDNPITEYQEIVQWLRKFIGIRITPQKFVHRLGIFLNRKHPIKISFKTCDVLEPGDLTIGALYDPMYDEENRKPLIMFFMVNCPKDYNWLITEKIAREISIEIIEALVHEYRHMYQYRSRNFKLHRPYISSAEDEAVRLEQEYLGNDDEIDAYASNIAVRFYLNKSILDPVSLDLGKYYQTFGPDHPVIRRLHKKITKYLQNLQSLENQRILVKTKSVAVRHRNLT